MDYVTFQYMLLVGIVFVLFYSVTAGAQWKILLAGSVIFYLSFSVKAGVYICCTIVTTYFAALWIEKFMGQGKTGIKKGRLLLILTVSVNLGILVVLKYSNFAINCVNQIVSVSKSGYRLSAVSFLLPAGVSFYTFQMVGYLLDIYWGEGYAEKNLGKYALFGCFFPQILSGPIGRYSILREQLFREKKFEERQVVFGLQRIMWGFFKKLVIAARVAIVVDTIFNNYEQYHGAAIWIGMFSFVLQLYTDFSGCMDIVIGTAQIFQVRLDENFERPFFSKNVSEFWRRWHITLGAWMRDYFFYPMLKSDWLQSYQGFLARFLGKKRARKYGTYTGMLILWFVMGLWHGASWKFVWGTGLWYFTCIVGGKICEPVFTKIRKQIRTECFSHRIFQMLRTFLIFSLGSLFFRASSLTDGYRMLRSAFRIDNLNLLWNGGLLGFGIRLWEWLLLAASCITLTAVSLRQRSGSVREALGRQNALFRWMIYYIAILIVFFMGKQGTDVAVGSFLYFQF